MKEVNMIENEDNFPYFLYEDHPDLIDAAKRLYLTPEMMEVYCYYFYMNYIVKEKITDYNFFDKHGGFAKTMRIIEEIRLKINLGDEENYDPLELSNDHDIEYHQKDYLYDIYIFGIMNPEKPFIFCELKPIDLYTYIKYLFDVKRKELPSEFIRNYSGLQKIKKNKPIKFNHWELTFQKHAPFFLKENKEPICITNFEKNTSEMSSRMYRFLLSVIKINSEDENIDSPRYELKDLEELKNVLKLISEKIKKKKDLKTTTYA